MFHFKQNTKVPNPDYLDVISRIKTSISGASFQLSSDEEKFFTELVNHAKQPRNIRLTRLANGTFNIETKTAYLGKIQLQGNKKHIQYLNGSNPVVVYGETVNDLIPYISKLF